MSHQETAHLLHRYISYRAEREGQKYDLTPEFFQRHLEAGRRTFFGTTVNSDKVKIIKDIQNPGTLKKFKPDSKVYAFNPRGG